MSNIERVKKVIKWIIYSDFAENDKELAELLGYTKSSFSQILNERVPLSSKFIDKICSIDKNINKVWILSGEGEMLNKNEIDNELGQNFENNVELLLEKISLLEEQNSILKENIELYKEQLKMTEKKG
jgi:hypothetical protein